MDNALNMGRIEDDWARRVNECFSKFIALSARLLYQADLAGTPELKQLASELEDLRCTLANLYSIRFMVNGINKDCDKKE